MTSIDQLGWSAVEALETHLRFRSFSEDWDSPGMEAYDVGESVYVVDQTETYPIGIKDETHN